MKVVKHEPFSVNQSDYRVEHFTKLDCKTRGGWSCYCDFYRVYDGDKLIAEVDEEHGQIRINGKEFDFGNNNEVERIELLLITNDSMTFFNPCGYEDEDTFILEFEKE